MFDCVSDCLCLYLSLCTLALYMGAHIQKVFTLVNNNLTAGNNVRIFLISGFPFQSLILTILYIMSVHRVQDVRQLNAIWTKLTHMLLMMHSLII